MDQPDSPPLRRRRSRLKQWLNERVPWRSSSKSSQSRLSSHIAPTKANAVPAETAVTSESSPHPSGTQIEPKIDSVEESVPEDAVGATNRKRQSPPTDSASAEPPAGTATLDEHRPTTHLSSPLNPKDVAAQPEQSPTQSVWHSESAPQWNTAVIQWKIEDPNEFVGMQKLGIEISESPIDNMNKTFRFQESEKTSKQTVARIKRWLPVLSAVRGIAMTAAALDPHKIAPIVCASVFFSIDVSIPLFMIEVAPGTIITGLALSMLTQEYC